VQGSGALAGCAIGIRRRTWRCHQVCGSCWIPGLREGRGDCSVRQRPAQTRIRTTCSCPWSSPGSRIRTTTGANLHSSFIFRHRLQGGFSLSIHRIFILRHASCWCWRGKRVNGSNNSHMHLERSVSNSAPTASSRHSRLTSLLSALPKSGGVRPWLLPRLGGEICGPWGR
jgi:hypothetical protein